MNEYRDGSARQRQAAVLALVRSGTVRSQSDLQHLLRKRGFAVAQPTLSRDLRELGLAKTPRGYVAPDEVVRPFVPTGTRETKLNRALRGFALSVQAAASVVVVKTPPAAAQPVARALDEADHPDIVGTIAGDDTVFVATPSDRAARALANRLMTSLEKRPLRAGA